LVFDRLVRGAGTRNDWQRRSQHTLDRTCSVINASVSRLFNITERFKLTLRGEAFNLTNTPSSISRMTFGDAAFSQITTANNAQSVKTANRLLSGLRITF
jgi:hypothetical protein